MDGKDGFTTEVTEIKKIGHREKPMGVNKQGTATLSSTSSRMATTLDFIAGNGASMKSHACATPATNQKSGLPIGMPPYATLLVSTPAAALPRLRR